MALKSESITVVLSVLHLKHELNPSTSLSFHSPHLLLCNLHLSQPHLPPGPWWQAPNGSASLESLQCIFPTLQPNPVPFLIGVLEGFPISLGMEPKFLAIDSVLDLMWSGSLMSPPGGTSGLVDRSLSLPQAHYHSFCPCGSLCLVSLTSYLYKASCFFFLSSWLPDEKERPWPSWWKEPSCQDPTPWLAPLPSEHHG